MRSFLLRTPKTPISLWESQRLLEVLGSFPITVSNPHHHNILKNCHMSCCVIKINTKIIQQRLMNQAFVVKCSKLHITTEINQTKYPQTLYTCLAAPFF